MRLWFMIPLIQVLISRQLIRLVWINPQKAFLCKSLLVLLGRINALHPIKCMIRGLNLRLLFFSNYEKRKLAIFLKWRWRVFRLIFLIFLEFRLHLRFLIITSLINSVWDSFWKLPIWITIQLLWITTIKFLKSY